MGAEGIDNERSYERENAMTTVTTLPNWCLTTGSNQLKAMAAQEYPACEVKLLGIRGVYWHDLIRMAEQREAVDLAAAQRNAHDY